MLVSFERFNDSPIMSLQTGSELARTSRAIINPRNLTIVAYELEGKLLTHQPSLLLVRDVREIGPLGMIIDSTDELVSIDDVVKVKEIYDYNFELIDTKVVDEKKRHLGKVDGYSIETSSFVIQQLRVKRPLFKSFNDAELLIHRSQIIKVSDNLIVVKAPVAKEKASIDAATKVFENPFRKTTTSQAETIEG